MSTFSAIATAMLLTGQMMVRPGDPPPLRTGQATIHGRVIDSTTEKPVAGVEVHIVDADPDKDRNPRATANRARGATTKTNEDGEFTFAGIAGGMCGLIAVSKTHLVACFGSSRQTSGPCVPIEINNDQEQLDADIFVRPAGIIRGRLLDDEGLPVARASIFANPTDSERMLGVVNSDQDGRFEIGGLPTGSVVLRVEVTKPTTGGVRAYYPGVLEQRDAQPIEIEAGSRLDIEMRVPRMAIGTIRAHVSGPQGFNLEKLVLMQPETKSLLHLPRHDEVATVGNVRGGRYLLEARATVKDKIFAAFATVHVGDGETDVPVVLQETATIQGRVVAERGGLPPLKYVYVSATWMHDGAPVDPSGPEQVAVEADGAFSFTGMFGTRVFRVAGLDKEWEVVATRAGRSELPSGELDIAPGSRIELVITVARR